MNDLKGVSENEDPTWREVGKKTTWKAARYILLFPEQTTVDFQQSPEADEQSPHLMPCYVRVVVVLVQPKPSQTRWLRQRLLTSVTVVTRDLEPIRELT